MKNYEITCMFEDWRIDKHTVKARNEKEAKAKVKKLYKQPRKATGLRISNVWSDKLESKGLKEYWVTGVQKQRR